MQVLAGTKATAKLVEVEEQPTHSNNQAGPQAKEGLACWSCLLQQPAMHKAPSR